MPSYAKVGWAVGLLIGLAVALFVQYVGWVPEEAAVPVGVLCGMAFSGLGVVTAEYLHRKLKGEHG